MKTYKTFMTEKKGDTIVFTFGRFNPPTVGHEILIKAVESVARSEGGDYLIFPSHSQDARKNPLTQSKKIKYMKKMFPGYKRNIVTSTSKEPLREAPGEGSGRCALPRSETANNFCSWRA